MSNKIRDLIISMVKEEIETNFLLDERFNCVRFDDLLNAPVILEASNGTDN